MTKKMSSGHIRFGVVVIGLLAVLVGTFLANSDKIFSPDRDASVVPGIPDTGWPSKPLLGRPQSVSATGDITITRLHETSGAGDETLPPELRRPRSINMGRLKCNKPKVKRGENITCGVLITKQSGAKPFNTLNAAFGMKNQNGSWTTFHHTRFALTKTDLARLNGRNKLIKTLQIPVPKNSDTGVFRFALHIYEPNLWSGTHTIRIE